MKRDRIDMQLEALNNGVLPKFQDESEPFYICKTEWAARVIYRELIQPRLEKGEFSQWYANHALCYMDEQSCQWLLDLNLAEWETPKNAALIFGGRPVVITFQNPTLVAKLTALGIPVATLGTEFPDAEQVARAARNAIRKPSEWPDPLPAEAYHGVAGDFVQIVEPETEADPAALLFNFLIAAGTLFGREAYVIADGKKHYPNEYLLMVGETGTGRKGTATNRVFPVMERVDEKFRDMVLGGLSSGEGLIKGVSPDPDKGTPVTPPVDDFDDNDKPDFDSQPPLVPPAPEVRRYLALVPEFASLLGVQKREGNTISAVLREAWDGGRLRVLTRKEPLDVDNVNLSIVGHITAGELLKTMTETEKINGYANRFLLACVRRSKLLPEGGKEVNLNSIVLRLQRVLELSKGRGLIQRDDAAREMWAVEYTRLTAARAGIRGALLSRAEAHVLRLSMLYALLDGANEIRVEHLKPALAVWEYCEQSVGYVFHGASDDPEGDRVLTALINGPLTTDEISRVVFLKNKPADWVEAKLAHMLGEGKIVQTTKDGERKKDLPAWAAAG